MSKKRSATKLKAKAKAKAPAKRKKQAPHATLFQPKRMPWQIVVGNRHRKDFGDLKALAASIDERGALLQPIVITPDNKLIAGDRRLRAWNLSKFAGQPIPVHVVDIDAIVAGEWDENAQRKDFTPSEAVSIKKAIEALLKVHAKERQRAHGGSAPGRPGKKLGAEKGNASDQAAKFTGKSRRTIEKAEEVVAAAEKDPKRFGKLKAEMDRTGKVDGPFQRLKILQQTQALRDAPPPLPMRGPYHAIVVDYPWPGEKDEDDQASLDKRGRAMRHYPEMAIPEGVKLFRSKEFQALLAKDCTVYFWATNHHLDQAFILLKAMGFETKVLESSDHSTIGTWVKNKLGRGKVLRGKTEQCIIACRGKPTINLTNQTTAWQGEGWEVREDSRKPDAFYALVEELTPAPRYAEIFSRGGRSDNWDCHGDEVGKFATSIDKAKQAEILAPTQLSDDQRMLVALEAIEKGEYPDLRLWGKKELKQLEEYAEGSKKLKLTKEGRYQLECLREEREIAAALAALPSEHAELSRLFREVVEAFAAAVEAKDRAGAVEAEKRAKHIMMKAENDPNLWLFWDIELKKGAGKIIAENAAMLGTAPLWGQYGLFEIQIDGIPHLVHAQQHFDQDGFSCDVKSYALDPSKPFCDNHGRDVHTNITIDNDDKEYGWAAIAGKSFVQWCGPMLAAQLKNLARRGAAGGKGKKENSEQHLPQIVYAKPQAWNGLDEPKALTKKQTEALLKANRGATPLLDVDRSRDKKTRASKKREPTIGDAIKAAIVGRTLPNRPQALIDWAVANGHVVRMHNMDRDGRVINAHVATCACGRFERRYTSPGKPGDGGADPKIVEQRIALAREQDDAITAHWRQEQMFATDAEYREWELLCRVLAGKAIPVGDEGAFEGRQLIARRKRGTGFMLTDAGIKRMHQLDKKFSQKPTADEPAAQPAGEGGGDHGAALPAGQDAARGAPTEGDGLDIPEFLRRPAPAEAAE